MNANLFTPQEKAQFAFILSAARKAALWNPLLILWLGFLLVIQIFVGYVEWEIAFQVFDFVSGDGSYWSPTVMAFTGVLMIIGFHVLAHHKPDSLAVRVVNAIASFLIPIYAMGLGLLVMAILFSDGLSDMLAGEVEFTLEAVTQVLDTNWIDWFFEQIANPVAVTVFALAAGGLAIVNLFISHHLISAITKGITTVYQRRGRYKEARADYAEILACEKRYLEISHRRGDISLITPEALGTELAAELLVVMQQALAPHKQALKHADYEGESSRFALSDTSPDPKQLGKDISRIETIDMDVIFKALKPS